MSRDPLKSFDENSTASRFDDLKERVSQTAAQTKDKAGQMSDSVSEKLHDQRENAAEGLDRVASALHDKAASVPGGPKLVKVTHSIADGMESTATYLREHDFSKLGEDLMNVCRKYPTQSFIAALALGFLVGRSARR
jgi:nitrogenase molybdenum-iron protein alpha/beta subunit